MLNEVRVLLKYTYVYLLPTYLPSYSYTYNIIADVNEIIIRCGDYAYELNNKHIIHYRYVLRVYGAL